MCVVVQPSRYRLSLGKRWENKAWDFKQSNLFRSWVWRKTAIVLVWDERFSAPRVEPRNSFSPMCETMVSLQTPDFYFCLVAILSVDLD